ncbi:hypothetical protein OKW98_16465 [Pseudomonas sp. KU26590]|uniref:hypothetical protein n=1 Tax=Pseudomonas sp. KU26590 TaxID=2991051 RepID=UPI00223D30FD|nr:hypothetical protein [Pseudomonas sp. KU26590]UZJ58196.1 hypothetical protein OKW98_16465 [Pseudomonas sp. KU26590]
MDGWVINPQWWLSTAVAAVMGAVMPFLYRSCRLGLKRLMVGAQGRIRSIYRNRKCQRLKRIKAIRFDSVAINRQITLSSALLVLFITTGVATIAAIINLPMEIQRSYSMTVLIGLVLAIPALLFEFAWLTSSSRLDDVMKSRKLIRQSRRGLY